MKKLGLLAVSMLLITSACTPSFNNEEEVIEETQDETTQETAIIPSYSISEEEYQVILPYKLSQARGVIVNQIANRLDIGELEEGLRRHSKETFSPEKYFFQEGQYLTEDIVYDWLGRKEVEQAENEAEEEQDETEESQQEESEEKQEDPGLNPAISNENDKAQQQDNPKYLSHILEQNYLIKTEENMVELGGISIGLAMKSVYRYKTDNNSPTYEEEITKKEMLQEGRKIAEKVVERIRGMEDVPDVPIMVAIYREEERNSLVPGSFAAKTVVKAGETSVGDWDSIEEENILFPSNQAESKYKDDYDNIAYFEQEVKKYFPNYIGVIGKGFYQRGQLKQLTIDIPVQFNGKAEIIGFTQYVAGLITETFPSYYDLEINITADEKQESLITRKADQNKPDVHIYH